MAKLSSLLLILFCLFLFFYRLGDRDLNSSHEGRAAQNAQMVLSEGQWALPRLMNNRVELQKPPLYYWLAALVGRIQGEVDAFAVRLPAAISALGCVLLLLGLGWKRNRPLAGLTAGLVLATSLHFTWLARVARIDMPLTFTSAVGLISFYLAREIQRQGGAGWGWLGLGWFMVGVGFLLKGPVALALVLAVLGFQAVLEHCLHPMEKTRPSVLARWSWLWGMPFALILAAPWFVWANHETNFRLWDVFFVYHNLERGLGSDTLAAHPPWYYLLRLGPDFFPWSLIFVGSLVWSLSGRSNGPIATEDPELRWGLAWFLGMLLFLSAMSFKRADYLLPAYPGIAWALGCWCEKRWLIQGQRHWAAAGFVFLVLYGLGWGVHTHLDAQEEGWTNRTFGQEIRRRTADAVIFFRVEAHPLVFHVGRPLDTILEWENLQWWVLQPGNKFFVLPEDCAREWPHYLKDVRLIEELRATLPGSNNGRPMVVFRSVPLANHAE